MATWTNVTANSASYSNSSVSSDATWSNQSVNSATWQTSTDQGGLNLYDDSNIKYDDSVIEYNNLGTVSWSNSSISSAPSWTSLIEN